MHVLIAGGGIGGLTAALCCLHFGYRVTVLEQAEELSEVGAGIQIPPNAMKVLDALSLREAISKRAFLPTHIETRFGESGATIFKIPLAKHAQKVWGASYFHIHRADYIQVLMYALEARAPESVRLNSKIKTYSQTETGVTVHLDGGAEIEGDLLIGADGIHSAVQKQMLDTQTPRFTGNVAWRAVVPMSRLGDVIPPPTACAWMGRGKHAVTYQLRGGELANFVGVVERGDWKTESWTEQGTKQQAIKDFAGWHPIITKLIAEADALFCWALYDREPLPRWTDGRVALLGDAAHPMLPFLAQGAAMATEDAWEFASTLSQLGADIPTALRVYQSKRLTRTSRVQAASRANAKTFHRRTPLGRVATYGPMWIAGKAAPALVRQRLDYLYSYDPTRL